MLKGVFCRKGRSVVSNRSAVVLERDLIPDERGGRDVFEVGAAAGQASLSPAPPFHVTALTPVQTLGTAFVGVHYWFENDASEVRRSGEARASARESGCTYVETPRHS